MQQAIDNFIHWLRRRNPDARTWRDYRCDLQQFAQHVNNRAPEAITLHDIDHFVTAQSERGLKATTINRRLAAIQSLYGYLATENPAIQCPVIPRRHALRSPRALPRPLCQDDLDAFFAVISNARDRAMFMLMLRCGLRISEIHKLCLHHLYLNELPPRLLVQGKNSKERAVYLSTHATDALLAYLDQRPKADSTALFLNYRQQRLAVIGIQKRLERYRAAAGLEITAHQLRHTFANDLILNDVPVTTVQKLMGHAWVTTTQGYIAANDPKVRQDFYAAVQKLEGWQ